MPLFETMHHSEESTSFHSSYRIGSVPYLNARPLVYGIEDDVSFEIPSILAKNLRAGKLDAALIPIVEYLEHPHYWILSGVSIACRGKVRSVYLAHRKPLTELRTVFLDPASKTSNFLVQVILAEFFKARPSYRVRSNIDLPEAQLLIGDPALVSETNWKKSQYELLDLGEVWNAKTHLPFVFACWAIQNESLKTALVGTLTQAKQNGLRHLEQIASRQQIVSPQVAYEYLTQNISYGLGAEETQGILEFQRLCLHHGLLSKTVDLRLTS